MPFQKISSVISARLPRVRMLRWRMTLSYTAVTVGALLFVELALAVCVIIAVSAVLRSDLLPAAFEEEFATNVIPDLRQPLNEDPPDTAAIQRVLAQFDDNIFVGIDQNTVTLGNGSNDTMPLWMFVLGRDGTLLGTNSHGIPGNTVGEPFDASFLEGLEGPVQAALDAAQDLGDRYELVQGRMIVVLPIRDEDETTVLGVLGIAVPAPTDIWGIMGMLMDLLPLLGVSLLLFTLGAGAVGTIFGFLTSRGLVRRLDRISGAADNWSQGDFSAFVRDNGADELSRLAQRMNRMAEQLQNLLETRNRLAILEERNRLARDLHDSAKQQAFAAAAQISAARAVLGTDVEAAAQHLDEAGELTYALRQELTALIAELRPVALEEKGLAGALHDYAENWSQREEIGVTIQVQGERFVPLDVEQTLFRITQEALSNVARHSGARQVEITLVYDSQRMKLSISDDGKGYDTTRTTSGLGLRSIRERVATLSDGQLEIDSQPGAGTQLTVSCLINQEPVR